MQQYRAPQVPPRILHPQMAGNTVNTFVWCAYSGLEDAHTINPANADQSEEMGGRGGAADKMMIVDLGRK